jgi:hypothetical protein
MKTCRERIGPGSLNIFKNLPVGFVNTFYICTLKKMK